MKSTAITHSHFIYETDNIPDHRSRRFGCCPCLLAVRTLSLLQQKSRVRAATQARQAQNESDTNQSHSALSSYHASLCETSRKGQFSINPHHTPFKEKEN